MSDRRPLDLVRASVALPDVQLGRGWEGPALFALTLLLLSFGLVTLYSASVFIAQQQDLPDHWFVLRQASGAAAGLVALVICARLPYRLWEVLAWPLVWLSAALLIVILLPFTHGIAPEVNGARRWLNVGVRFQPSDLAKVAIIVWTAMLAVRKQGEFKSLGRGLAPFLLIWAVLLIPVALEPDLSTALLMATVAALIVFAAGGRIAHFAFLGVLGVPVLISQLNGGFRLARIKAFLDPTLDPEGTGYQLYQSLIALGSGGLTGRGFGNGQQKYAFLPESHNDFIFAMVGEEWGFLGVAVVVALYMAFIVVGFRVARRAPDLFGQLLALGITNLIALHAVLHMMVGVGLLPTTGLALPLVSYGRTNLVITLALIGILLSIARETDRDWHPEQEARRRVDDLARAPA
ncbi:MAG: putative lipid II flippase FtsW, partial [Gemmatimonadetes bacterium]|nr:putative lipid II flippase FtsW [Gemmatimonadota bacterium]